MIDRGRMGAQHQRPGADQVFSRMLKATSDGCARLWTSNDMPAWKPAVAGPSISVVPGKTIPSGWPRSSDRFGAAGAVSCFGNGIRQQAMPQQPPFAAPWQHDICPGWAFPATARASPANKCGYRPALLKLSSKLPAMVHRIRERAVFMTIALYNKHDGEAPAVFGESPVGCTKDHELAGIPKAVTHDALMSFLPSVRAFEY